MNYLSLFTGAGGGDLGMQHLLGFRCRGYVEYEPYCQEVIKQRITDGLLDSAPIFGDIRAFISEGYAESYQGMVDVVTGGFPCQDISCAGSGAGIEGERSGLWKSMAEAIRIIRPRYAFVENSPMLTIRGLGTVLRDLAEMGFDARWGVLGADDAGFCHGRKRIWIVAADPKMFGRKHAFDGPGESHHKWRFSPQISTQGIAFVDAERFAEQVRAAEFVRNTNGLAGRMDRITAIGNGQVPLVAATAFRILSGGLT